jgi:uracil-DNA glycosylase
MAIDRPAGHTSYDDMQALGARCDVCPLRKEGQGPCGSEIIPGTDRVAVAQEPGKSELLADRPFAGRAGAYLDDALVRLGTSRHHLSTTTVVACMSPGGDVTSYESKLRRRNKKRESENKPPIPTPTECCTPRMHREVAPFLNVIPFGPVSARALVPSLRGGIGKARGRLVELPTSAVDPRPFFDYPERLKAEGLDPSRVPDRRILPMMSPGFVLRESQWDEVFMADLDRAWRWWRGELRVFDTKMIYRPGIADMERLLIQRDHPDYLPLDWLGTKTHFWDWETDGIRAMTARRRCLGIGTTLWGVIVPYDPVQWRRETEARQQEAVKLRKVYESQGCEQSEAIRAAMADVESNPPGIYESWYTMDDGTRLPLYDAHEQAERDRILKHWGTDASILKVGWNSGQYDRIVTECQSGWSPTPHLDGIQIKRSVQPELPNDLGTVGSVWTDLHDWKGNHTAVHAKTDETLWRYCVWDNVVPGDTVPRMYEVLKERQQTNVLELDHVMQSACVGMHYQGMRVDQEERQRLDLLLASPGRVTIRSGKRNKDGSQAMITLPRGAVPQWTLRLRQVLQAGGVDVSDIVKRSKKADAQNSEWQMGASLEEREAADVDAGDDFADAGFLPDASELGLDTLAFNPLSHPQLRAVLFDEWELPIPTKLKPKELYTKSGEISTGDSVLRQLMVDPNLTDLQRKFIHSIRMVRRHAKMWGTYVRPFRPPTGDLALDKACRTWVDGRLHPNWNNHTPVTGRFSSSGPNAQNLPALAKGMIVAAPGNLLVGADMDQLELRIAAARWGAARYLEAFAKGIDPHQMTMEAVFGRARMMAFQGAPSKFGRKDFERGGEFEKMRKLAKAIQYASQYAAGCAVRGGSVEVVDTHTVFRLVTSAEDKKRGVLLFPDLTEMQVGAMHENWLKGCPEFIDGWLRELALVKAHGCIYEPITWRRRDFTGQRAAKMNEFVNFPIQASGAGLMNKIMADLVPRIPFGYAGPGTGIINQCHDSITVECPEHDAQRIYDLLIERMNVTNDAFPGVDFTADPGMALRAKDPLGMGQSRWSET